MDAITELKQERAELVQKQRNIIDKAENEDRNLNADEERKWENIDEEIDKIEDRIERKKKIREREKREIEKEIANDAGNKTSDNREVFKRYLRRGRSNLDRQEKRQMEVSNDSKGGYIVPTEFHNEIIDKLEEENIMRQIATVNSTSSERKIPIASDYGTAEWVDEGSSYTESDIEFDRKTVDAHKAGTIIKVSEELLYDNDYNLEQYIQDRFVRRVANLEEEAFIKGDGSGEPEGILDKDADDDLAAEDAITADEIFDIYHELDTPYRQNASWLVNDTTVKAIRKLTDSNDQYLWQPGLQAGEPDELLGQPVRTSSYMPELETDEKAIIFGDMSYYQIFDRNEMFVQRLEEKYADEGMVGFRAYRRVDGLLLLDEAIVVIETDDGQ